MAASRSAPYLISKHYDRLFALFIGLSSAWVRIRREEVERSYDSWHARRQSIYHDRSGQPLPPLEDYATPRDVIDASETKPRPSRKIIRKGILGFGGGWQPTYNDADEEISEGERRLRSEVDEATGPWTPPTNGDTLGVLWKRLKKVNPREWDLWGLATKNERWGIIDKM